MFVIFFAVAAVVFRYPLLVYVRSSMGVIIFFGSWGAGRKTSVRPDGASTERHVFIIRGACWVWPSLLFWSWLVFNHISRSGRLLGPLVFELWAQEFLGVDLLSLKGGYVCRPLGASTEVGWVFAYTVAANGRFFSSSFCTVCCDMCPVAFYTCGSNFWTHVRPIFVDIYFDTVCRIAVVAPVFCELDSAVAQVNNCVPQVAHVVSWPL